MNGPTLPPLRRARRVPGAPPPPPARSFVQRPPPLQARAVPGQPPATRGREVPMEFSYRFDTHDPSASGWSYDTFRFDTYPLAGWMFPHIIERIVLDADIADQLLLRGVSVGVEPVIYPISEAIDWRHNPRPGSALASATLRPVEMHRGMMLEFETPWQGLMPGDPGWETNEPWPLPIFPRGTVYASRRLRTLKERPAELRAVGPRVVLGARATPLRATRTVGPAYDPDYVRFDVSSEPWNIGAGEWFHLAMIPNVGTHTPLQVIVDPAVASYYDVIAVDTGVVRTFEGPAPATQPIVLDPNVLHAGMDFHIYVTKHNNVPPGPFNAKVIGTRRLMGHATRRRVLSAAHPGYGRVAFGQRPPLPMRFYRTEPRIAGCPFWHARFGATAVERLPLGGVPMMMHPGGGPGAPDVPQEMIVDEPPRRMLSAASPGYGRASFGGVLDDASASIRARVSPRSAVAQPSSRVLSAKSPYFGCAC